MNIKLPQNVVDAIKKAPRGVVPAGIKVAKTAEKAAKTVGRNLKKDYVSENPGAYRLGNTYTRYAGVVSILKKNATDESTKQAIASRKDKERKAGKRR